MFDKLKKKAETTKEKATLIPKANFGDARAQHRLGFIYEQEGNGPEAIKWFTKAANNSSYENASICMSFLAGMYYNGYLGAYKTKEETVDYYEAFKWYKKAVEKGHEDKGVLLHEKIMLAYCYYLGRGTEIDYYEAVRLFRESWNEYADISNRNNEANCAYFLGECYLNGYGVQKNVAQAVYWYKKAEVGGGCAEELGRISDRNEKAKARLRELGY